MMMIRPVGGVALRTLNRASFRCGFSSFATARQEVDDFDLDFDANASLYSSFRKKSLTANTSTSIINDDLSLSLNPVPNYEVKNSLLSWTITPPIRRDNRRRQQQSLESSEDNGLLKVVPTLKTFYSQNPLHENNMEILTALQRKYCNLPRAKERKPVKWLERKDYVLIGGDTRLTDRQFLQLNLLLHRLNSIDDNLKTQELINNLKQFEKKSDSKLLPKKSLLKPLNEFAAAVAIGRRKSSSAKAYVVRTRDGEAGKIMVNGQSLNTYFPKLFHKASVVYPLEVVNAQKDYNIWVIAYGGGQTGQADAIKLAITKALIIHNPLLKARLRKAKCVTRDARIVERKKPGKLKARKAPTWVKR
ncbi:mitochondrial 37S ribosomal protein uS9m ASCRUDRAFT_73861 [Ascoidea rubescens DSM 1968]|uniref:Small ribosomal subunit protein uS9m n=1 Tax=Ascoidea rubescens DSM 1968 TaxID=1344418 RepID=A0A1D2VRE8_9ASCO|nr:hypothetical protein ASCRUDRAFT_73861 [Ascoidea rubescens DSM 1968]ODV64181.1 hypothetical protein ASCRUDRAFT_73861 [Ascoidea rubescens DSM 1968]